MKTLHATTAVLLLSALSALAQGTVNFSTRVTGAVIGHVYGIESTSFIYQGHPVLEAKRGNTTNETPAGTQIYTGQKLEGSGFSAQLWAANGIVTDLYLFQPVPGSLVSFRTGTTLGGTPVPTVVTVPWIPPGGTGTFQVVAWDNAGGTLTSYANANFFGASDLFTVSNLGDGFLALPANMVNYRSFNLGEMFIPEPAPVVLLGFCGLVAWLSRRKLRR